jgi:hypothetical protein
VNNRARWFLFLPALRTRKTLQTRGALHGGHRQQTANAPQCVKRFFAFNTIFKAVIHHRTQSTVAKGPAQRTASADLNATQHLPGGTETFAGQRKTELWRAALRMSTTSYGKGTAAGQECNARRAGKTRECAWFPATLWSGLKDLAPVHGVASFRDASPDKGCITLSRNNAPNRPILAKHAVLLATVCLPENYQLLRQSIQRPQQSSSKQKAGFFCRQQSQRMAAASERGSGGRISISKVSSGHEGCAIAMVPRLIRICAYSFR